MLIVLTFYIAKNILILWVSLRRHPFLEGTDIIGILDNSGNIVVKYKYDAYGNCTRYY